jgi:hypothetical protein
VPAITPPPGRPTSAVTRAAGELWREQAPSVAVVCRPIDFAGSFSGYRAHEHLAVVGRGNAEDLEAIQPHGSLDPGVPVVERSEHAVGGSGENSARAGDGQQCRDSVVQPALMPCAAAIGRSINPARPTNQQIAIGREPERLGDRTILRQGQRAPQRSPVCRPIGVAGGARRIDVTPWGG